MTAARDTAPALIPPALTALFERMRALAAENPESPGFVPAVGDPTAALCLIGEAPAEYEVREGRPFAGPAGRVLDELLGRAALRRDALWLTNVVKFRTVKITNGRRENRAPLAGELKAWLPLLHEELAIVQPRVVVCLGATAGKAIAGRAVKMTEQRGEWFPGPGEARMLLTFHPAYVLHLSQHNPEASERAYDTLLADLRTAAEAAAA